MIDGLRRRARLLLDLKAQIVAEDGFVEFDQLAWGLCIGGRLRPAGEVQQVEGVGAQGARGALE